MIGFFPKFYPDELVYSLLARYYDHAGYHVYRCAAEELFVNPACRPNPEFVNLYTDDALHCITRYVSMEEVVLRHTMLPAYRFLPAERLQRAFHSLVEMNMEYCNALPLPTNEKGKKRYMRYCPVCVRTDREAFGECYWHRMHQIIGVNICPKHRCFLIDSSVVINATGSPSLTSAEAVVNDIASIVPRVPRDIALALYTCLVFNAPMDIYSDVLAGDFLNSRLEGTPYISRRGASRDMVLFQKEFLEFYAGHTASYQTEIWQFQKVYKNQSLGLNEVCMIAFFLGVSIHDLCNMVLPEKSQVERFDEQIKAMHNKGMSYPKIAEKLNAKLESVKNAGEGRYRGRNTERRRLSRKGGRPPKDWALIDAQMLPKVRALITELREDGSAKPKRVTKWAVERLLALPERSLNNMPECLHLVKQSCTSQEEHWARLVEWAIRKIRAEGGTINWKGISRLTNMRKRYLVACLPYLQEAAAKIIELMLQGQTQ